MVAVDAPAPPSPTAPMPPEAAGAAMVGLEPMAGAPAPLASSSVSSSSESSPDGAMAPRTWPRPLLRLSGISTSSGG